jgi:ATP-dependent DNA helicase RecQ
MMTPEMIQNPDEALGCFVEQTTGIVCANAVKETISDLLTKPERQPAAAYCMAWLQVAGGNSVLPPWVRHRFPEIPAIIRTLRQDPCGSSDCDYCRESHDPERQLTRFFGFPSFRENPQTAFHRFVKTPKPSKTKACKGRLCSTAWATDR